jgi:hypothetical protein
MYSQHSFMAIYIQPQNRFLHSLLPALYNQSLLRSPLICSLFSYSLRCMHVVL